MQSSNDLRNQILAAHEKALPDKVLGFFFDYRALSNFHLEPFIWKEKEWLCAENAYQAAKTVVSDWDRFCKMTPATSKREGRLVPMRPDWDLVKVDIMLDILTAKFSQCKEARSVLLKTGNAHLEEVNWWKDVFWGTYKGKGQNQLGLALMQVRQEIALGTLQQKRPST
jgi:ribA/ribD-fused uncharacterized protein